MFSVRWQGSALSSKLYLIVQLFKSGKVAFMLNSIVGCLLQADKFIHISQTICVIQCMFEIFIKREAKYAKGLLKFFNRKQTEIAMVNKNNEKAYNNSQNLI